MRPNDLPVSTTWAVGIAAGLVLLCAAVNTPAQYLPTPSWFTTTSDYSLPTNNPALASVHPDLLQALRVGPLALYMGPGEPALFFKLGESEIVMVQREDVVLGARPSGLARVLFAADRFEKDKPDVGSTYYVVGVDAQDRPAIRYVSIPNDPPPTFFSHLSFQQLIPPGTPGERFVSATLVGSFLYVVEGTTEQIRRYRDTDGDGLPDALDPVTPYALQISSTPDLIFDGHAYHLHFPRQVIGFTPAQPPYAAMIQTMMDDTCEDLGQTIAALVVQNGAFEVVEVPTAHDPVPHLRSLGVAAGMRVIRIGYPAPARVWIELNGRVISNIVETTKRLPVFDLALSADLVEGQHVRIVASDGKHSDDIIVGPPEIVLFDGQPSSVIAGKPFHLKGANFSAQVVVEMSLDHGKTWTAVVPDSVTPETMTLTSPPLPKGQPLMVEYRLILGAQLLQHQLVVRGK